MTITRPTRNTTTQQHAATRVSDLIAIKPQIVTANAVIDRETDIALIDARDGDITVGLPTGPYEGKPYVFRKASIANIVEISGSIDRDGSIIPVTRLVSAGETLMLVWDATARVWRDYTPLQRSRHEGALVLDGTSPLAGQQFPLMNPESPNLPSPLPRIGILPLPSGGIIREVFVGLFPNGGAPAGDITDIEIIGAVACLDGSFPGGIIALNPPGGPGPWTLPVGNDLVRLVPEKELRVPGYPDSGCAVVLQVQGGINNLPAPPQKTALAASFWVETR